MEEEKIIVKDKILKAFIEFQKEMPEVRLDSTVKVKTKTGGEYKFKYATLANILKKALPILTLKGLGITQTFKEETLITTLIHESGQTWDSAIGIDLHSGTMQEIGSRISYLKRYGISAMLGIVAEEDDDANIASGNDYKHEGKPPLTEPQPKPLAVEKTTGELKITKVILKEDVGKDGKPYKKYTIVDNNDNKYTTFSDTFASIAKDARDKGFAVEIESEKGRFGLDLISIEKVSSNETPPPGPSLEDEKNQILDLLRSLATEPEHVDAMCIEGIGKKAEDEWMAEDVDKMQGYVGMFEKTKEAA